MAATTITPSIDELVAVMGYRKATSISQVPDLTFGGEPSLGETVWAFSRGGFRRGIVTKIGTKKATVSYVTEGGVAEGQRFMASWAATSPESIRAKYEARNDSDREWTERNIARDIASHEAAKSGDLAAFVTVTNKGVPIDMIGREA